MMRLPLPRFVPLCALFIAIPLATVTPSASPSLRAVVELEEEVYRYVPADNGAGPLWCAGSTCLVRDGDRVFATGLETIPSAKPLNNVRWLLFERQAHRWNLVLADPNGRTREPSPLAIFPGAHLLLSVNPTLNPNPDAYAGPAQPQILQFKLSDLRAPFHTWLPEWSGTPQFTEHSYRSFAADGPNQECLLLQNVGYTHAEWAFRDRSGNWSAQGQLHWPVDPTHEKPQPIRICYPNVALHNRAAYFCGVSDIIEPNPAWRAYKKELTGREWDYDFRRLFFTWSPNLTREPFQPWIEIASRDQTCGGVSPGDLWVAPDQAVHILWTERALDERLREKFFPEARQTHQLNYAILRDGQLLHRRTLIEAREGESSAIPAAPRFHITPDNRLFVICYVSGAAPDGTPLSENRLFELGKDGEPAAAQILPFKQPFTSCFTATPRAGSKPSEFLDLLGTQANRPNTISYARVRLSPAP
ncbi:MAG: hypothetical protein KJ072_23555 [Verrucomicrobia bacterium]|nr:hypothetical protein [Verrucomicrobiota bacterium]